MIDSRPAPLETALGVVVARTYSPPEYPALGHQIAAWPHTRPLQGCTILDATPVFTNTLVKYLALQAAGAQVTVSAHRGLPGDPAVIAALGDYGVGLADESTLRESTFDIVCDCAGTHSGVASRFGYVELTRSGVDAYAASARPVFVADAGRIKRIETSLGTGDGFVRAMSALGHEIPDQALVVVFGGGKVGSGVAVACRDLGARVVVVDPDAASLGQRGADTGIGYLATSDGAAVGRAVADAWCVVAATGVTAALTSWAAQLLDSPALLANMGATDEFGPDVPTEAVLHDKIAVNFALDEPTRLRYLDPTMALSNAGAVELRYGRVPPGPTLPPTQLEDELLAVVVQSGAVAPQVRGLAGVDVEGAP